MIVLKEKHDRADCPCSHCQRLKDVGNNSFGFWSPEIKEKTSWWTFWFVGKKIIYYFRFNKVI